MKVARLFSNEVLIAKYDNVTKLNKYNQYVRVRSRAQVPLRSVLGKKEIFEFAFKSVILRNAF